MPPPPTSRQVHLTTLYHTHLPDGLPGSEVSVEEEVGGELETGGAKLGLLRMSGVQGNPLYPARTHTQL